jgi:TPR repeat protein
MNKLILAVTFSIIVHHSAIAETNICVKYARSSDWLTLLIVCQDRAETDNDPIAAYILGYMYQNGIYVSPNLTKSAEWYKIASINGDSQSQINLGIMFMRGQGVEKPDKYKGMLLIKQAAKMGHKTAISLLNRIKSHDLKKPSNYAYQLEDYLYILNGY